MIVTAITEAYLPGLFALHRSIGINSPNSKLVAMVYGDYKLHARIRERGIETINGPTIDTYMPVCPRHEVAHPSMYIRLWLPKLFPDERRVIWMDADQVVLKPLDELYELDLHGFACAMVPSGVKVSHQVTGSSSKADAAFAGLMVMDVEQWNEEGLTLKCAATMAANKTNDLVYEFVVQSVINHVLAGKFYRLSEKWQRFGNRSVALNPDAHIVHWHGHSRNPWTYPMRNLDIWNQYGEQPA